MAHDRWVTHSGEESGRPTMLPMPGVPAPAPSGASAQEVAPSASAMRRVLRRARDGATLNVDEATTLLQARGDDLADLCSSAAKVRDAGLLAAGRPKAVTYSRKVFIPLTRLCRDKCHYCTFVTVPGKLRAEGRGAYLEPDEVLEIARQGAELGCKEALFTLGDRPEDRWPEAKQWLDERGYDSTLDYLRAMSIRVLEETGLLPHLNPGVMSWEEISRLKPVAPSMGMMLETTSTRLFTDKGECHYGSPDKDPAVRLRTLTDAGTVERAVHDGHSGGYRRDRAGTGGVDHGDPQVAQGVRARSGSDRPELPRQARHRDARCPGRGSRGVPRDHRRVPVAARPGDAHPVAAQPGVEHRVPGVAGCGCRRLGWCVAADPGPREPGAAVAEPGHPGRDHRGGRVRAHRAHGGAAAVRAGRLALDRPADHRARAGPRGPAHRAGQARHEAGRVAVAGAGRVLGVDGPGGSEHRDRHRRPQHRDAQRPRQRVRGLGDRPRAGAGVERPGAGGHGRRRGAAQRRTRSGGAAPTTSTWRWRRRRVRGSRRWWRWRMRSARTPSATR